MVVNHNGGELTLACLRSVLATDWPAGDLEATLVDNGSSDGIAARVKTELPQVLVVESGANRGFAGGCNLALRDLDGIDFVALVNNDATVDPGWLRPLVGAIEVAADIGAASPRILFADRFVDLQIDSPTHRRGRGDRRDLGVRMSGVRLDGAGADRRVQLVDGFWGPEHASGDEGAFQWTSGRAHVRVPVRADGSLPLCELRLSADQPVEVSTTSGACNGHLSVGPNPEWHAVEIDGDALDVVNNVGCRLLAGGFGADRGYLEPDHGQFTEPEEIFGWCGAAVLLSRQYLDAVGGFEERFFLYYEDLDLSWRGRSQGWRHVYVPESVVRHVHSATTIEGSVLVDHYVERNRLLTLTRNAPAAMAIASVVKHMAVTASYARRDVLSPLAHGRRPAMETIRRRNRALAGFARNLPASLADRRRLRRHRTVDDHDLLAWSEPRIIKPPAHPSPTNPLPGDPPRLRTGASAVEALIEERRSGR